MLNKIFKKSLVIGIIILLLGAIIVPMIGAFVVSNENKYLFNHSIKNIGRNGWWDFNWSFCKQLTISNPIKDYQMLITVFKENGHDDAENGIIDCEGNCEKDFSDIRFIDQINTTLLPYWIEETGIDDGDNYSRIWVKTTGDSTIFIYYGNPYAVSLSNGISTFFFFDDFDSYKEGEPNPDGWSIKTCSFETTCSVYCNTTNAYDGRCLDVYGDDEVSNSKEDEYSVASRTINLAYGEYEIRTYIKPYYSSEDLYGYVRKDGTILITKNNSSNWSLEKAKFMSSITDIELVTRHNRLWDGQINVYYDNLFIRKYNFHEPYWANFSDQYKWSIPNTPTITGPVSGKVNTAYPYTFISIAPDGSKVSYFIEWGDGNTTTWTKFQSSGPPGYIEKNSWNLNGTYVIQAKAKDIYGTESDWATLTVTMPKNKALTNMLFLQFFYNFLQNHPNLFPVFKKIIQKL